MHLSMKIIATLSECSQNKQVVLAFPGLVESIEVASTHMYEAVRAESARLMMHLSSDIKNALLLMQGDNQHWLDVVLALASSDASKAYAVQTLGNLTAVHDNKPILVQHNNGAVITVLLRVASSRVAQPQVSANAARIMGSLTCQATAATLVRHPGLLVSLSSEHRLLLGARRQVPQGERRREDPPVGGSDQLPSRVRHAQLVLGEGGAVRSLRRMRRRGGGRGGGRGGERRRRRRRLQWRWNQGHGGQRKGTRSMDPRDARRPPRPGLEDRRGPPIHEPPLLHVGAASLAAGRRLLRVAKSDCAMRESGLVVTDERIMVELRTNGTALCLPLMVNAGPKAAGDESEDASTESISIRLMPDEEYLRVLADEANDRLRRDERLLEKLLRTVREGLFSRATEREENSDRTTHRTRDANEGWATEAAAVVEDRNEETDDGEYRATLTPLPPLKLWKSAAAVLPRNASEGRACGRDDDLDLFAFGGQGIGPTDRLDADGRAPTCRRGDEAYRLSRRNGAWSDRWEEVVAVARTTWDGSNDAGGGASTLATSAGSYRVRSLDGIGGREGHAACALPSSANSGAARPHAMAVFGGRTGGPSAPTNDLFFFVPGAETGVARSREGSEEGGALGRFGRPTDVRGDFPEARFGHTMTALTRDVNSTSSEGEPLAVVAGGVGLSRSSDGEPSNVCLSSVHVLSRVSTEGFGVEDGLCHLRWDRLADLPSPRSYHAASFAGRSDRMYVFGGSAEVDDPFPSFDDADGHAEEGRSWFAVSLFGEGPGAHGKSDDAGDGCGTLPPGLVGCAAASLPLRPNGAVLCVGGVRGSAHPDSSDAARDPLSICSMPGEGDARGNLARARVKIDLAGAASENGSPGIDFGSCVHPCLASLPRREGVEVASVLLVGGGVPSFSFGQAYSRSYLIDVARVKSDAPSPRRRDGGDEPRSNNTKARPKVRSSIMANGKSTVQTDVVYVAAPNAKRAKGALESLGFLDKRYKMVKADYCLRLTDNDADRINGNHAANVAIPITKRCVEKLEGETTSDDLVSVTLRNLSLRFGTEEVPYSASSIAKMKQRRGLPG
ncbi:hypothetical protein ACHAWF_010789 [Thalassiosira exigua]